MSYELLRICRANSIQAVRVDQRSVEDDNRCESSRQMGSTTWNSFLLLYPFGLISSVHGEIDERPGRMSSLHHFSLPVGFPADPLAWRSTSVTPTECNSDNQLTCLRTTMTRIADLLSAFSSEFIVLLGDRKAIGSYDEILARKKRSLRMRYLRSGQAVIEACAV